MMRAIRAAAAFTVLIVMMVSLAAYAQPTKELKQIFPKMYLATGLEWKGESTQNTNWNKICEDPKGRIWWAGGDHWGTDRAGGVYNDRYDRPWGFGNTTVHYYDPKTDKAVEVFELDRASAIYSNAETPGHGKIHSNIQSDSKGRIWAAGYLGSSYNHEFTNAYFPKSYAGGALVRYDPSTDDIDYFGIPTPYGGQVALYLDEKRTTVFGFSVDRARFWSVNYETMELKHYETNGRFGLREMIMDNNGRCYFVNEYQGLTRFDPNTETFTDLPIKIPGLRASCVSKDNIIYGICSLGFVWSLNPKTLEVKNYGHVVNVPDEGVYTPNICIDDDWQRLYFIAGGHGVTLAGMPILTILDLKTGRFLWPGKIDIDGSYGAVVGKDHSVYFGCYAYAQKNGKRLKNSEGKEYRTNYLIKYEPPRNLEDIK